METGQFQTDTERAEMFREFVAQQMRAQTKSLETIKTLMLLWALLGAVAALALLIGFAF